MGSSQAIVELSSNCVGPEGISFYRAPFYTHFSLGGSVEVSDELKLFDIIIVDFEAKLCLKNVGFFLVSDIEIFGGDFTHEI